MDNEAPETHYNLAEVAEKLKVHQRTVKRWIKLGKLDASKVGRSWIITRIALRDFLGHKRLAEVFDIDASSIYERAAYLEELSDLHIWRMVWLCLMEAASSVTIIKHRWDPETDDLLPDEWLGRVQKVFDARRDGVDVERLKVQAMILYQRTPRVVRQMVYEAIDNIKRDFNETKLIRLKRTSSHRAP